MRSNMNRSVRLERYITHDITFVNFKKSGKFEIVTPQSAQEKVFGKY